MVREVQSKLSQIEDLCREYRVERLFLFGSALGPSFNPASSDVDFVVVFKDVDQASHADRYFGLLERLSTLLERSVDLVEARLVKNPYMVASINRTKKLLYAA